MQASEILVLGGTTNPDLAALIARDLGLPLGALDAVCDIWVTDSIAHDRHAWPQLHIVSVAPLLAKGLMEIHGTVSPVPIY